MLRYGFVNNKNGIRVMSVYSDTIVFMALMTGPDSSLGTASCPFYFF